MSLLVDPETMSERFAREDREHAEREAAYAKARAEQDHLDAASDLLMILGRACQRLSVTDRDPKNDGDFFHEGTEHPDSVAYFQGLTERLRAAGLVEVVGPFDFPRLTPSQRRKVIATEAGREKVRALSAALGLAPAGARLLAARAGAGDAAESYLEAADALLASQERFGRAERDLRACVERMQAEEKILERAEAELQAAADAAERLL